jgi:hypothetical protein
MEGLKKTRGSSHDSRYAGRGFELGFYPIHVQSVITNWTNFSHMVKPLQSTKEITFKVVSVWESGVWPHAFLTSALCVTAQLHAPVLLPLGRQPLYQFIGSSMCPRGVLEIVNKRKGSSLSRESNPRFLVPPARNVITILTELSRLKVRMLVCK